MALDSNGIHIYQENDSEATASDLLNLLAESTSGKVGDLQTQVDAKQDDLGDTGWVYANYSSSFVNYGGSSTNRPRYRRLGPIVEVMGIASPANTTVAANITSSTGVEMFTLPSGFRPSGINRSDSAAGSNSNHWRFGIGTDGVVTCGRYGSDAATTTTWLPFSMFFFVN